MSPIMTKDYEKFKLTDYNRPIDSTNLKKIKASIQSKNLLELRPILVNTKFEIIDGQHRFQAAKELGIPFYYTVHDDHSPDDVVLLNTQKAWNSETFFHYFCSQGNENYIRAKRFMKKYGINLTTFTALIGGSGGSISRKIRNGTYEFSIQKEKQIILNYEKYIKLIEFISNKYYRNSKFLTHYRFINAFFNFINENEINWDHFLSRVEMKLNLLRNCTTIRDYYEIFVAIYNFRNSNPLIPKKLKIEASEMDYAAV